MIKTFFTDFLKKNKYPNQKVSTKDVKPYISSLLSIFPSHSHIVSNKNDIEKKINIFLAQSVEKQILRLPSFYLYLEQYLANINPDLHGAFNIEKFRKSIKAEYGHIFPIFPGLEIIFAETQTQTFELYKLFLNELSGNIIKILGNQDLKWNELQKQLSNIAIFPSNQTNIKNNIPRLQSIEDWNVYLIDFSEKLYEDLETRFNTEFATRFYNRTYETLAETYRNLDNFHEILKLFPNRVLDEEKLGLLSNQQIKLLLMEKVQSLEKLSNELIHKNEALEQAGKIIEDQNEELKLYSENLERLVQKRTLELDNKNKELVRYIGKLEQYTFTVSHSIRGPIARLLGLTDIFRIYENEPEQQKFVIPKIEYSAKELDQIIKDLNRAIEIKNDHHTISFVNLKEVFGRLIDYFTHKYDLEKSSFEIYLNNTGSFLSNGMYIESIFYNILSNAIVFANPQQKLLVKITSEIIGDKIKVSVLDNGLGIDTEMYRDKLFGFYQRFHTHIESKGLGLFLTKEHVEALNGQIELFSKPNVGTQLLVTLPYTL